MSTVGILITAKPKFELESARRLWDWGNEAIWDGSEGDAKEFLMQLAQFAYIGFVPNVMHELIEYFTPAAESIYPQEVEIREVIVSPFTGKSVETVNTPGVQRGGTSDTIILDIPLGNFSEAALDRRVQAAASVPSAPASVQEGTYTVVFNDGEYRTVKIKRNDSGGDLHGKLMGGFINGPDNETNFQMFCFINEPKGNIKVWNRFQTIDHRWVEALEVVIAGTDEFKARAREAYALKSGRCSKCGRKLTVPASLFRGMGPECASRA